MPKPIHLFDPLISTPNIGTKKRNKIEIKNKKGRYFITLFFSWVEITISKTSEIETKIRCLIKKKYVCLFIFSATTEEVDENEKKSPRKKRKMNKKKISLYRKWRDRKIKLSQEDNYESLQNYNTNAVLAVGALALLNLRYENAGLPATPLTIPLLEKGGFTKSTFAIMFR